jgi:hypothetical protein
MKSSCFKTSQIIETSYFTIQSSTNSLFLKHDMTLGDIPDKFKFSKDGNILPMLESKILYLEFLDSTFTRANIIEDKTELYLIHNNNTSFFTKEYSLSWNIKYYAGDRYKLLVQSFTNPVIDNQFKIIKEECRFPQESLNSIGLNVCYNDNIQFNKGSFNSCQFSENDPGVDKGIHEFATLLEEGKQKIIAALLKQHLDLRREINRLRNDTRIKNRQITEYKTKTADLKNNIETFKNVADQIKTRIEWCKYIGTNQYITSVVPTREDIDSEAYCLDYGGRVRGCDRVRNKWTYDTRTQLISHGNTQNWCMNSSGGYSTCDSNVSALKWEYIKDTKQLVNNNKCLTLDNNNNYISIRDCNRESINQKWNFTPTKPKDRIPTVIDNVVGEFNNMSLVRRVKNLIGCYKYAKRRRYTAWGFDNSNKKCYYYNNFKFRVKDDGIQSAATNTDKFKTWCTNANSKVAWGCKPEQTKNLPENIDYKIYHKFRLNPTEKVNNIKTFEDCRQYALNKKYVAWGWEFNSICNLYNEDIMQDPNTSYNRSHVIGCTKPKDSLVHGCFPKPSVVIYRKPDYLDRIDIYQQGEFQITPPLQSIRIHHSLEVIIHITDINGTPYTHILRGNFRNLGNIWSNIINKISVIDRTYNSVSPLVEIDRNTRVGLGTYVYTNDIKNIILPGTLQIRVFCNAGVKLFKNTVYNLSNIIGVSKVVIENREPDPAPLIIASGAINIVPRPKPKKTTKWAVVHERACPGHDIKRSTKSVDDCKADCASNKKCRGIEVGNNLCLLKSRIGIHPRRRHGRDYRACYGKL